MEHILILREFLGMKILRGPVRDIEIYESRNVILLVGHDTIEDRYRVFEITRASGTLMNETTFPGKDHGKMYKESDIRALVDSLNCKSTLSNVMCIFGVIKLLESFYLLVVTKADAVAEIHGHTVYNIVDVMSIAITFKVRNTVEESKYKGILSKTDFGSGYYFSFTYDLTNSLQSNILQDQACSIHENIALKKINDMFAWNTFTSRPFFTPKSSNENVDYLHSSWVVPIIYGFVAQKTVHLCDDTNIAITLVARRSRYFAGTRYLRRGTNNIGYVANEVETEQIITRIGRFGCKDRSSSLVQLRGSIPLYWSHVNLYAPNPDIQLEPMDSKLTPTRRHFKRLFRRYGENVVVLSLVRQQDSNREILLENAYREAMRFIQNCIANSDMDDLDDENAIDESGKLVQSKKVKKEKINFSTPEKRSQLLQSVASKTIEKAVGIMKSDNAQKMSEYLWKGKDKNSVKSKAGVSWLPSQFEKQENQSSSEGSSSRSRKVSWIPDRKKDSTAITPNKDNDPVIDDEENGNYSFFVGGASRPAESGYKSSKNKVGWMPSFKVDDIVTLDQHDDVSFYVGSSSSSKARNSKLSWLPSQYLKDEGITVLDQNDDVSFYVASTSSSNSSRRGVGSNLLSSLCSIRLNEVDELEMKDEEDGFFIDSDIFENYHSSSQSNLSFFELDMLNEAKKYGEKSVFNNLTEISKVNSPTIGFFVEGVQESDAYQLCRMEDVIRLSCDTDDAVDILGETPKNVTHDGSSDERVMESDSGKLSQEEEASSAACFAGTGWPCGFLQNGVFRTNCVDCLDRTNVGQFFYARHVFPMQFRALGFTIAKKDLFELESLLLSLWVDHGETMAQQYGGSGAMHKMDDKPIDSSAKNPSETPQTTSSSANTNSSNEREFVLAGGAQNAFVAVQRFYSNISTDFDRQQSLDLLLGVMIPRRNGSMIWEMEQKPEFQRVYKVFPWEVMDANHVNDKKESAIYQDAVSSENQGDVSEKERTGASLGMLNHRARWCVSYLYFRHRRMEELNTAFYKDNFLQKYSLFSLDSINNQEFLIPALTNVRKLWSSC